MSKNTIYFLSFAFISLLLYVGIAQIPRSQFYVYISLITSLFSLYVGAISLLSFDTNQKIFAGIFAAIVFRFVLLFFLPQLSDDYFRFAWDGKIIAHGANPFLYKPSELIKMPQAQLYGLSNELFSQLNSPNYYTIYPPVCQGVMGIACWLFPQNLWAEVLCMKLMIWLAEIGSILLMFRLLSHWKMPIKNLFWYAWNPLVIIEFCGNLHFEAFMLFFLLLTLAALSRAKVYQAAIFMAFAICSKLLPLMLFPFFLRKMGIKKFILFSAASLIISFLLFLPLLNAQMWQHFLESSRLYFQTFEFNASIYYLVRWVGFQLVGYNILFIVGKFIPFIIMIGILGKSKFWQFLSSKSALESISHITNEFLFAFTLYFAFATTVNPWYIAPLVGFAVFTPLRFPMIWTVFLPFSYYTYHKLPYQENLWLIFVEYAAVLVFFIVRKEWKLK